MNEPQNPAVTNDPTTNAQRVLVRQTVTGFEQVIAGIAGLVTGGPVGIFASWVTIRGLQGKWTPWFFIGVVTGPLLWIIQIAVLMAIVSESPENNDQNQSMLPHLRQDIELIS